MKKINRIVKKGLYPYRIYDIIIVRCIYRTCSLKTK